MVNKTTLKAMVIALILMVGMVSSGAHAFTIKAFQNNTDGQVELKLEAQDGSNKTATITFGVGTHGGITVPCPTKLTVKKLSAIGNGKEVSRTPNCNITKLQIDSDASAPEGFTVLTN